MFFSASVRLKNSTCSRYIRSTTHECVQPWSPICEICLPICSLISLHLIHLLPCFFPPTVLFPHFSLLFPHNQACHHSLRVPTCVASTLKRGWSWMMPDTEPSSHWPNRESKPEPSPLCRSRAPTLPSLPCGLLSFCCGVTRPTCHSLLAEWLTREKEKVWEREMWERKGEGRKGYGEERLTGRIEIQVF